jgi:hypothetical protein
MVQIHRSKSGDKQGIDIGTDSADERGLFTEYKEERQMRMIPKLWERLRLRTGVCWSHGWYHYYQDDNFRGGCPSCILSALQAKIENPNHPSYKYYDYREKRAEQNEQNE